MYFPSGRSQYQGVHLAYHAITGENPARRLRRLELNIAYTFSRYRSNIAEPNGSGGDYSILTVAEDYNRPHRGYWGSSGFDRTHQLTFTPTADLSHGLRLSMIAHLAARSWPGLCLDLHPEWSGRARRVSTPSRHVNVSGLARRWVAPERGRPFTEFTPDYWPVSQPATRESPLL